MPLERKILAALHERHDAGTWGDYSALYCGGKAVRERSARFIARNPKESIATFQRRSAVINYHCYLGQIVDYLVGFLRGANMAMRVREMTDIPEHYTDLREDADGQGTDLQELACNAARDGLVYGMAWWRVVKPVPTPEDAAKVRTLSDHESAGLSNVRLEHVECSRVLDWELGDDKKLDYVVLYEKKTRRVSPAVGRSLVVETWEVIDRTSVQVYQVAYEKGRPPPTTIPEVPQLSYVHGFNEVPFVQMDFCKLWLADRISIPLVSHLRKTSAMQWNLLQCCYAMPVFYLEGSEGAVDAKGNGGSLPTMGASHGITLGIKEKMEWIGPPTQHLATLQSEIAVDKDEIYRVVNQMAQGVDNNASAVGRSGLSKAVDAESTTVIVRALGKCVSEHLQRALAMVAAARGETDYKFSIEGLDSFSAVDPLVLSEAAELAFGVVDIQSPTFQHELKKKIAMGLLADAAQNVKDKIAKEIDVSPITKAQPPTAPKPIPEKL